MQFFYDMKFFDKISSKKKIRRTLRNEVSSAKSEKEILREKILKCSLFWGVLWAFAAFFVNFPDYGTSFELYALPANSLVVAAIIGITVLMWRIMRREKNIIPSITLLFVTAVIFNIIVLKIILILLPPILSWHGITFKLTSILPFGMATFIVAMMIGGAEALLAGVCISLLAGLMNKMSFEVTLASLFSSIVIASLTYKIRRRSGLFKIGVLSGIAVAFIFAIFANELTMKFFSALFAILTGLAVAVVVLVLLPIFEKVFRISSDISLLELSDMEHPLLKRLAEEAPGTYHHSIMTANLAQAAVNAIGGNGLRAAICAYFHDIGKLAKPEFFVENSQTGVNPHDDLAPSMSALVIISHVKEGVDLAIKHRLPLQIIEAIEQHHGTTLVHFFYHKALQLQRNEKREQGEPLEEVKEETFRYPGPKPLTKENAILALADSIEAASRALEKITPANIEDLVENVIAKRVADGQLDLSDLTFSEITKVKRAFSLTLSNMLHGRISYPTQNANSTS